MCYGYDIDLSKKMQGQIAHIDGNPANNHFDNLAWLCFDHHDQYDSQTSQSKGITPHEIKYYRDAIYALLSGASAVAETPDDQSSTGTAENRSYINGGLKHLVRVDLLLFPDKTVSGIYSIRSEYSDEEEDRLCFGFVGKTEDHLVHVFFPSHRLPYPTDPFDQNCSVGRATWRLKVYANKEAIAITTFGRNHETMDWNEYTFELDRIVIRPDEQWVF